jgi:hypothetical protein
MRERKCTIKIRRMKDEEMERKRTQREEEIKVREGFGKIRKEIEKERKR